MVVFFSYYVHGKLKTFNYPSSPVLLACLQTSLVTAHLIIIAGSEASLLASLLSGAGAALIGRHVNLRSSSGAVVLRVEMVSLVDVVSCVDDFGLDGLPVDHGLDSLMDVAMAI